MSNNEFVSAVCRRNAVEDPTILSREDSSAFQCGCDGGAQSKLIDPFGYHLVRRMVGTNAIRLHDEVVSLLGRLFSSLRFDAIVEPTRLFAEASGNGNSQRPDILPRFLRGFGRQITNNLVDLEPVTNFHINLCKSGMSRKWLNMVRSRTRADFSLSLSSLLTLTWTNVWRF